MDEQIILKRYNNNRTRDKIDIINDIEFDIQFLEFRYQFYKFLIYKESLKYKSRQQ